MIKPDGYMNIGKIIDQIYNRGGFTIGKLKLCRMSKDNAAIFYGEHQGKPFYDFLIEYITSDFIVGMELIKENAIQEWRNFIGPTNVEKAKKKHLNHSEPFLEMVAKTLFTVVTVRPALKGNVP